MQLWTIIEVDKTGEVHYPKIHVSPNGPNADYCNEIVVSLQFSSLPTNGTIWTTCSEEQANKVLNEKQTWYNSSIDYPVVRQDINCTYYVWRFI